MKLLNVFTSIVLFIGLLSGCAISPVVQENALPSMPFSELIAHADQYKGRAVILGGYVLEVENHKDYTKILAVQAPLGPGQRLKSKDLSKGRLILIYNEFVDPEVYSKDRKITVGGNILEGTAYDPELSFPYLKIQVNSIHLWPEEKQQPSNCLRDDVWINYQPWFLWYP
jgi:outer membrane lipoprotein